MIELLEARLALLSEEDREVLALRFTEQKSAKEIASHLGLRTPREAYTRIERALRRIRSSLDDLEM